MLSLPNRNRVVKKNFFFARLQNHTWVWVKKWTFCPFMIRKMIYGDYNCWFVRSKNADFYIRKFLVYRCVPFLVICFNSCWESLSDSVFFFIQNQRIDTYYSVYTSNVALLNFRMDDRFFLTESYPKATTPCLWFLEVLLAICIEMIAVFIHSANFLAMEKVLLRHLISKPCFFHIR